MTAGANLQSDHLLSERRTIVRRRGRSHLGRDGGLLMPSPSHTRRATALGAVALLMLIGLGLAQTGVGKAVLRSAGIATPSAPYTELAFVNPADPGTAMPGGDVRVDFWIHNAEGAAHTYRWTAATNPPGRAPSTVTTGVLGLANGASATVATLVPVACASSRSRISVSLGEARQTIGFWESCPVTK